MTGGGIRTYTLLGGHSGSPELLIDGLIALTLTTTGSSLRRV